jgi:hypothetical protein
LVTYSNALTIAVTLPVATTSGFTSGARFHQKNIGVGTVTVTPTTSQINGASTLVLTTNQDATIFSDGTNYWATVDTGTGNTVTGGTVTAGQLVTSIAAITAVPSGTATPTLGTDNSVAGTLQLATNSANAHTILASGATTSYTFTTPTTAGTNHYLYATDGSGNGSWTGAPTVAGTNLTGTGASFTAGAATNIASGAAGEIPYQTGAGATGFTSVGTAKQIPLSGGAGAPTFIDFPERFMVPAANCNNTTAGAGWSIGSGGTVTCRAGTNNLGGFVAITDTSSSFAQFTVSIPGDWDTGTRPYMGVAFESATDTTSGHTVIPEVAVSCPTATNGTSTDDVTLSAYQSLTTVTFGASAVAHGFYTTSAQLGSTQMSGCVAGGFMVVSIGRATDTATGVIGFEYADITFPRLLVVGAQ